LSDTTKPAKISREGVILIKSFEGFRPRAIQRADGRWSIGYGHTRSAREGLTVSESDAELLLQYDLIPVAEAVRTIQVPLNQHQFDALSSFAFSVGVDRFKTSNVLARLNAGAPLEAANALTTWVDDPDIVTPPRRRAAERALFVADPDAPASLADLLAAPLPPPTAILVEAAESIEPSEQTEAVDAPAAAPFPALPPSSDSNSETQPQGSTPPPAVAAPSMTREAAVAALLGEGLADATDEASETASDLTPDLQPASEDSSGDHGPPVAAPLAEISTGTPSPIEAPTPAAAATFYSPYAVRALGPLVGFGLRPVKAEPVTPAPPSDEAEESPLADQPNDSVAQEPAAEQLTPAEEAASPDSLLDPAAVEAESVETTPPTDSLQQEAEPELQTAAPPSEPMVVPVFAPTAPVPVLQAPPAHLTLTGAPEHQTQRPEDRLVWPEHNASSDPDQAPLFEPEGGSVDAIVPSGFKWSETLTFLAMGVIGLLSFGASMAAFRQASASNGEPALIGWVLAVIALACVGASAYNLYRRWGRVDQA
jgi:GH24 family phage-related lysozyme (muramidase)